MLGIIYSFITAILRSFADVISKHSLDEEEIEVDSEVVSLFYRLTGVPVLFIGLLILGIPEVDFLFYKIIVITSLISVIATIAYVKALEISDISVVSPIKAFSPILVIVSGFILIGELPGVLGIIGIILIGIGSYIINLSGSDKNLLDPIKRTYKDRGVQLTILVILLYSISAPLDKIGVEATSPIFYSLALYSGSSIGLLIYNLYKKNLSQIRDVPIGKMSSIGIFNGGSSFFQMTAFSLTLVVYVVSIKRLSLLINTLYGVFFLNEGVPRYRLVGAFIMIIGSILISVSVI